MRTMRPYLIPAGAFFLIFFAASLCGADGESIASKKLISEAKTFDGKEVSYKGEAVTALIKRDEYSWVNINDGDNALGVWCKTNLLREVRFFGDHKHGGDSLMVKGTFHRACPEHGGELDIHAEKVDILSYGYYKEEPIDMREVILSILLFFAVTSFGIYINNKKS